MNLALVITITALVSSALTLLLWLPLYWQLRDHDLWMKRRSSGK